LNLYDTIVGDAGAKALLRSPHLKRLEELDLWSMRLSEDMRRALDERFGAAEDQED
jgi:hypothetical protein